jgi:hypothetical protein
VRTSVLSLAAAFTVAATVPAVLAADKVDAQIKQIAARVNAVDAQLERAVHYERKETNAAANETATEQAWLSEPRDLLKVARERVGKTDRARKEVWFRSSDEPIFVLTYQETTLDDGRTRVEESRRYFDPNDGQLIRELTKQSVFKAGEALATKQIKNVTRAIAKVPERERSNESYRQDAHELTTSLVEAGPPKHDPGADAPGDSARFRLIHGSASPDGRYAVALGFPETPKSWDDFVLNIDTATGTENFWIEEFDEREKGRNYVVDLTTHRIILEMPAEAYATQGHVGRDGWAHHWSPDSKWLVQSHHGRWSSGLRAIRIDGNTAPGGPLELTELVQKQAAAFLKTKKDRSLKGVENAFGFYLYGAEIANDGLLTLSFSLCVPGSKSYDNLPSLIERFRLKTIDGKLQAQFVDARYD